MTTKKKSKTKAPDIQAILNHLTKTEKMLLQCQTLLQQQGQMITLAIADGRITVQPDELMNHQHDRLPEMQKQILTALANCHAAGISEVPRQWLAILAGLSANSGAYGTALANLTKVGSIRKVRAGMVALSDQMREAIKPNKLLDSSELCASVLKIFHPNDADILETLLIHGPMNRTALAEKIEQSVDSSSFQKRLAKLRKLGFVTFGQNSTVSIPLEWFIKVIQAEAKTA